jgi:DNA recombination protein RmuC
LQDILKNPKQRGVLGEYFLKTVLENVFAPNQFQMQYGFKDGTIVDAVIFVQKNKVIPVDSKFSLENYNRLLETKDESERQRLEAAFRDDLKSRIDETSKYIKPGENTMDFAFMFIPSEAVYYDLLINKVGAIKSNTRDLIQYAGEKKVMIVSPTTFLAYIQTVLQGLKALKIEESAKEIAKRVGDLSKHLLAIDEYMKKLGAHLGTTVGVYGKAYKELGKIDKDVLKISGKTAGIEPLVLEKPQEEEESETLF